MGNGLLAQAAPAALQAAPGGRRPQDPGSRPPASSLGSTPQALQAGQLLSQSLDDMALSILGHATDSGSRAARFSEICSFGWNLYSGPFAPGARHPRHESPCPHRGISLLA